ncbi:MAG: Hemin uptake protein hemP [Pseudomonadota bacterium]
MDLLAYPGHHQALQAALLVSKALDHLAAYVDAGCPRSGLRGLVLLLEQVGEAAAVDNSIRAQAVRLASALERGARRPSTAAVDRPVPVAGQSPMPAAEPGAAGVVDSSTLLQGRRELRIAHRGETYQLRLTRQDKLILTK